jgi:tRNA A37 threonylcarbamoyladenosine biosynthesis protein TsaE
MELLKDYLESDRVVILHGFGGSGKTEIAKKYVFENKLKYDAIIFTNYTSTLTDILIS